MGAKKSAAYWANYLVTEGHVDAAKSVQIGMRGDLRTLDWCKTSDELGYEVITMDEYKDYGPSKCIDIINDRIGDAPLYITFDLDCLDPSVAPGVSNLKASSKSMDIDQAKELLHGVRGKQIIGGDVVCLMPSTDQPNKITSFVAAAIMFEMICLIADRKKNVIP